MDRSERRRRTESKIKQRLAMAEDLGLQQGTLYEAHREKVKVSGHYMADGNVSHYVSCGFGRPKASNLRNEVRVKQELKEYDCE